MEYSIYVRNWIRSLDTEIEYWKNRFILISQNKASLIDVNKSPFVLEKYLPKQKKIEFLDVGSGPFSRCGGYSKDHVLNMTYVDPLGNVYENLKSIYKVSNGVFVKRGFVELLDKIFGKNSFDVVHMSNALDHCFDPIFGLMQLISVCKIGGKVILRHNENEALNEQYSGLHQWNIAINNYKFMIWNETKTIDVNEILSDFVDFKLSKNEVEDFGGWNYCHIEMTKKKDIEIPSNDYVYNLLLESFDAFSELICNKVINQTKSIDNLKYEELLKRISNGDYDDIIHSPKRKVVWGYGTIGKALVSRMKSLGEENFLVLDQSNSIKDVDCCSPSSYQEKQNDVLLITFIRSKLARKIFEGKSVQIIDLLENC